MVRVRALFAASGLTLVELGERMGYSAAVARQAAWQFMRSSDPRMSMLRKFAQAMEVDLDDLTPKKGKRMSRQVLESELERCGCELTRTAFRELLEERRAIMYPAWTVDELVCHPDDAKEFCHHIRDATGCPDLPDDLILRNLMNARRAH